jgi:MazG family protein
MKKRKASRLPKRRPLDELIAVIARLRSPKGCPWDRKQTHVSLIRYLREEARELEHAIRKGAWHEIEDELGDLLLQIVLHAQIAREDGRFDIQDVARSQVLKLKRRHPHVFGGRRFKTAEEVVRHWDELKGLERRLRRGDVRRRS